MPLNQTANFPGHPDWVSSVTFSPDGKTLAVGSYETITLHDMVAKSELAKLKTKTGFVRAVAYSPDGTLLVSGSYQTVTVWDANSRSLRTVLAGHRGYVTGVAFSPDGKLLATSSEDETAKVWDMAENKEKLALRGHRHPVHGIAFSPDGLLIATAAGDVTRSTRPGEVKIWDALTGEVRMSLPEHARAATSVSFSRDGKLLATASYDETVKLWEVTTGKEVRTFAGHSRPVNSVVFSPPAIWWPVAAAGGLPGRMKSRFGIERTARRRGVADDFEAPVTSLAFAPGGASLAAGCNDKAATVWDISPLLALAEPRRRRGGSGERAETTPSGDHRPRYVPRDCVHRDSERPCREGRCRWLQSRGGLSQRKS